MTNLTLNFRGLTEDESFDYIGVKGSAFDRIAEIKRLPVNLGLAILKAGWSASIFSDQKELDFIIKNHFYDDDAKVVWDDMLQKLMIYSSEGQFKVYFKEDVTVEFFNKLIKLDESDVWSFVISRVDRKF